MINEEKASVRHLFDLPPWRHGAKLLSPGHAGGVLPGGGVRVVVHIVDPPLWGQPLLPALGEIRVLEGERGSRGTQHTHTHTI